MIKMAKKNIRGKPKLNSGARKLGKNNSEAIIMLMSAVLVLLSALLYPLASAVIAVIIFVIFALYKLFTK